MNSGAFFRAWKFEHFPVGIKADSWYDISHRELVRMQYMEFTDALFPPDSFIVMSDSLCFC